MGNQTWVYSGSANNSHIATLFNFLKFCDNRSVSSKDPLKKQPAIKARQQTLILYWKWIDKIARYPYILILLLGAAFGVWVDEPAPILACHRFLPFPANSKFLYPIRATFGSPRPPRRKFTVLCKINPPVISAVRVKPAPRSTDTQIFNFFSR